MAASPKVNAGSVAPVTGSTAAAVAFTDPSAIPARGITVPQHGAALPDSHGPVAVQRDIPRVGFPPPVKPYRMSMSPGVLTTVVPFAVSVLDWLNSKSMFAVPSVSRRTHAR